MKAHHDDQTLT